MPPSYYASSQGRHQRSMASNCCSTTINGGKCYSSYLFLASESIIDSAMHPPRNSNSRVMYTSFSSNGDKNICVIMMHDRETFSCFPSPPGERRPCRAVVLIMYLDCYWLRDHYEPLARCLQSPLPLVWADGRWLEAAVYVVS